MLIMLQDPNKMEKAYIWLILFRGLLCCVFEGTDFMIVSPMVDGMMPGRVLNITASGKEGTSVLVSTGSPVYEESQVITSSGLAQFSLQHSTYTIEIVNIPFPIRKNGIRVTATEPVVVFVYADDVDGYTAIARTNMTSYVTVSATASHQGEMGAKSYIAIAAFEEGTEVVVHLRKNEGEHEILFGDQEYVDNNIISAVINAYDVMFIWCFNDLTGSHITVDKPVSVIAGATCAQIPVGSSRCQAVAEQMVPNDLLLGEVLNFPVFDVPSNTLFRVISVQSTTDVFLGSDFHEIVQRGSFVSWESSSPYGQVVSSNKTVINVQYQPDGGTVYLPLQTTMLPFSMFSTAHVIFALPDVNTQLVLITSKSQNNVYEFVLDGHPMAQFTILEVHSAYVAFRKTLSPGIHTLRSLDTQPVAVYVYSYGTTAAFSFHGACTLEKLTEQSTTVLGSSSQAGLTSSVIIIQSASSTSHLSGPVSTMSQSPTPPSTMSHSSTPPSAMSHSSTPPSTMSHSSTPPSAMSHSSTPPSTMSHSSTPPSAMSHSSTPPSTMSQSPTPPSTMSQSPTPPSTMSQSPTPPSTMSHSSTPPSTMSHSSTPPSTMSQSPTPPSTMSHSSTPPSTMSHSSTPPSTMSQSPTPPSTMSQSPTPPSTMSHSSPPPSTMSHLSTLSSTMTSVPTPVSKTPESSTRASTVPEPSTPLSTTPQSSAKVSTMVDPSTPISQTSNKLDSTTVIYDDSAVTSAMAVTSPQTRFIPLTPSITTSPCTAACHYLCYSPRNDSQMLDLIRNLTLMKRSLGSSIRKRISVHDDRPSAKGIGYTGLLLMLVPICLLFLGDLNTFIRDIKGHIR